MEQLFFWGRCKPIREGKQKAPFIDKQIKGVLRDSWVGNFLPKNLLYILDLLTHLLDQYF